MVDELMDQQATGPKVRWTKQVAVSAMVGGGALILLPWFMQVEEGTALHFAKVGVGLLGFIILCIGAYKRP